MSHYTDILVATDGSEPASAAVDHAVELADGINDTVYVLSVADDTANPMAFGVETVAAIDDAIEETATEMSEHLGKATVEGTVRRGSPSDEILAVADEADADVIVLGRGTSGLADRLLGSTADRVVERADRPVVIVPASVDE